MANFSEAPLIYMLPQGMQGATSALVGNAIGAGDPGQARKACWLGPLIGTLLNQASEYFPEVAVRTSGRPKRAKTFKSQKN